MSMVEEVEALRNVPLFASLDETKLKLLSFTSEWVEYQPGQSLCKEGEKGEDAFVIMQGEVDIYVETKNGPLLVAGHGAGEIVVKPQLFVMFREPPVWWQKMNLLCLKLAKKFLCN